MKPWLVNESFSIIYSFNVLSMGTCYYQMNAEKFAYYTLGSTGLKLMVPLVKIVSREAPHPRIPYGHGVVPNIEDPLSLEEITQPKDVIFECALELISTPEEY